MSVPGGFGTTGADGSFAISLPPADYVLEVMPVSGQGRPQVDFSEKDWNKVDQDYHRTYWPGGRDLASAMPLTLTSGNTLDVGQLTLKKVPLYRVRGSLAAAGCPPGGKAQIAVGMQTAGRQSIGADAAVPCGKDFLLTRLAPGSYRVEAWIGVSKREDFLRASVPFEIVDQDVEIAIAMTRGVDFDARLVLADGAHRPDWSSFRMRVTPVGGIPTIPDVFGPPDSEGRIPMINMELREQRMTISGVGSGWYVKEIRYNGSPVPDAFLRIDPYAVAHKLEIVIDDKPAVLSGVVGESDRTVANAFVVAARWPAMGDVHTASRKVTAGDDGKFQIAGLAPGEYRLAAVAPEAKDKLDEPNVLERLLSGGQKVTLGPNVFQSVTVQPADPSR
jgi:hypothetical protein